MLNITVNSNILSIVKEEYTNYYTIIDTYLNVNAVATVKENGKIKVSGKGSKNYNAVIKGYIEEFKIQIAKIENLKETASNLLENIMLLSNGKISIEDINININAESDSTCMFTVKKVENEYYSNKIGWIEINLNTFEIVDNSRRMNEDLEKFITAYNKFINADNEIVEVTETIVEEQTPVIESIETIQPTNTKTTTKYFVYAHYFNTIEEAQIYCDSSDFDYCMIEMVEVEKTSTDCNINIDNTITNTIETPSQAPESIVIPNQSIIYTYENISIHAKIENYISRISGQQYNQINDITITKDNNIIYKAYNICFPVNPQKEYNIIDFDNYAEYICKYIIANELNNIDFYWTNIKLNDLLKEKNTSNFDCIIRGMKKQELEQIKQAEHQEKQNNINSISQGIEQICNDKHLLFYKDYSNIIIIANAEYYTNKERTLSALKTLKNSSDETDYNKWFKPFEISNISLYYSDTLELLKQAKESILKYKYKINKAM